VDKKIINKMERQWKFTGNLEGGLSNAGNRMIAVHELHELHEFFCSKILIRAIRVIRGQKNN
jgi:hypothetical protein